MAERMSRWEARKEKVLTCSGARSGSSTRSETKARCGESRVVLVLLEASPNLRAFSGVPCSPLTSSPGSASRLSPRCGTGQSTISPPPQLLSGY